MSYQGTDQIGDESYGYGAATAYGDEAAAPDYEYTDEELAYLQEQEEADEQERYENNATKVDLKTQNQFVDTKTFKEQKNTLKATLKATFNYDHLDKSKGPLPVSFSKAHIEKAFKGQISGDQDVFVTELTKGVVRSTAPYTMQALVSGLEGKKNLDATVDHEGNGYAFDIHEGVDRSEKVISEMELTKSKFNDIFEHGKVDLKKEVEGVTPLPGTEVGAVQANSMLAKFLHQYGHEYGVTADELTFTNGHPIYTVSMKKIVAIKDDLQKKLSGLPKTNLSKLRISLARFDNVDPNNPKKQLPFTNVKYVSGKTDREIETLSKVRQQVQVTFSVEILKPDIFDE